jgi:hypothetical protein
VKDWDKGRLSELLKAYDTTPIGRAKFLCALKEAVLQYVETEAKNTESNNRLRSFAHIQMRNATCR